ncbi:MAG: Chaperone protein HtpG [Pedosphaera sp.]|nr:Chaperone protein HtpG [Pedosphaera sp.]
MPQIFRRRSNSVARASILGVVLLLGVGGWTLDAIWWSPHVTRVNVPIEQPVPFSHEHHYTGLGIDCRYCHTSVEKSSTAGIPPTYTCMTCHSQLYTDAPLLEPVRRSLITDTPLRWNKVNSVPDFVYFNHSIHVNKGIGCSTCHGPVNKMPLTWKANTLYMKWCLECHRNPAQFIRPREEVFNMGWLPPADQLAKGGELVEQYHVNTRQLTDCSMCHR